jgi:UDP-N-acetylmuramoyl-tripeptide--D-alanyl-D-alanine ligase
LQKVSLNKKSGENMYLAKIELFGIENILITILISTLIAALLLVAAEKIFGAFQQLYYNEKKLLKWANKPDNMIFSRLILLSFLIFLSFSVLNLCLSFSGSQNSAYFGFSAYFLFFVIFLYADKKFALKVPVKNTARMKRLKTTFYLFNFLFLNGIIFLLSLIANQINSDIIFLLRYLPLAAMPLLCPFFVILSGYINRLFETPKNKKYIKKATDKIKNSEIIKIGITGSYGKTSVKNILKVILSEKFKVLATPNSYNTPLGIAGTINNNDINGYDVFIAEMGAKNQGDIKELCDIVKPKYSIITGICAQHLETFKSIDNIKKTKYEIVENTDSDGKVIFGSEDLKELYDICEIDKYIVGKDIFYQNCEISENGSKFTLCCGAESVNCQTKLLGKHNVDNILTASLLAYKMGMNLKEISVGVSKINFEKHRLELLKPSNGLNILDDSYNANIIGAVAALKVLKLFKGKKVVVTPGIVELGILEQKENYSLGQKLAFCDKVILVGETLILSIKDGLLSMGYEDNNIIIIPELKKAANALSGIVTAGDTVLFLNDLPDIYK